MKDFREEALGSPPLYIHGEPVGSRRRFRVARRLRSLAVASLLLVGLAGVLNNSRTVIDIATGPIVAQWAEEEFQQGLQQCYAAGRHRTNDPSSSFSTERSTNPRWEPRAGQSKVVVLRNATLFDGDSILPNVVDIVFEKGLIRSVAPTGKSSFISSLSEGDGIEAIELHGKFVTPGLVDMHSHHLESSFPALKATGDINEAPGLGPITPFVRAIDGFKPYDPAIKIIASGGVTSSLNLPGSANIVGGEAYLVKNLPTPGPDAEPLVEDLLFDYGLGPTEQRRRYLKLACGENPKGKYSHTRLGLAWLLREHLDKARELNNRQEAWCRDALDIAQSSRVFGNGERLSRFLSTSGTRPGDFELETTVALLRGELNVNVHCYEPEDFESILSVLHEFNVHVNAFHHALEAWQVPEFLKRAEP